jgi:hypothetical protein
MGAVGGRRGAAKRGPAGPKIPQNPKGPRTPKPQSPKPPLGFKSGKNLTEAARTRNDLTRDCGFGFGAL